jgi:membrane-bound serine protease (ClpP class)
MELWVWAVLLLLTGLGLATLEIFVPNGGILGFLAICAMIGSVILAFRQGPVAGVAMLAGALVALPLVIVLALKYWPDTPIGRRIMLGTPRSEDVRPDFTEWMGLKDLLGHVGHSKSTMLPSGAILVNGRTIDAVSEGGPIESGQRVRVIEVRGSRVVVRPVEEEVASPTDPDPLARPIESVAPDPFQEPD